MLLSAIMRFHLDGANIAMYQPNQTNNSKKTFITLSEFNAGITRSPGVVALLKRPT